MPCNAMQIAIANADTVITNATIPMEWFIPAGEQLDFVATLDSTGVRARVQAGV